MPPFSFEAPIIHHHTLLLVPKIHLLPRHSSTFSRFSSALQTSPSRLHPMDGPRWTSCFLTSSPLASLLFFPYLTSPLPLPPILVEPTCRNFQFLPTNHHHLSFQCTRIIPTARLLEFIKNTNPLISTMFTTLTPLPPPSLGNPA